jgi:hypothetical protein
LELIPGLGYQSGEAPSVGPRGGILFIFVDRTGSQPEFELHNWDPASGRDVVLYQSQTPLGPATRGPTGAIADVVGYGQDAQLLILSPDGRPMRSFSTPGVIDATWGPHGDLVIHGRSVGNQLINPRTGTEESLPDGYPSCWSPSGRWLLMTRGARLNLLDFRPPSGPSEVSVGHSNVGPVLGCAWLRHAGVA